MITKEELSSELAAWLGRESGKVPFRDRIKYGPTRPLKSLCIDMTVRRYTRELQSQVEDDTDFLKRETEIEYPDYRVIGGKTLQSGARDPQPASVTNSFWSWFAANAGKVKTD